MKYIFIIQGEGRGHLTQAISMHDLLTRNGHEITEVLVGKNKTTILPDFFSEKMKSCPISVFESPCFLFSSKNKKSLFFGSIFHNLLKLHVYLKNVLFINRQIRKSNADVVVNF
ncbi:MAG: glycosyltransferase, partial [Bacteroidales bacterium]|nr:glycosyltransferase [Bacteroidales bacterium]